MVTYIRIQLKFKRNTKYTRIAHHHATPQDTDIKKVLPTHVCFFHLEFIAQLNEFRRVVRI